MPHRPPAVRQRVGRPGHLGDWLVFFDSDGEPLMSICKADVVSFWRAPIKDGHSGL